MKFIHRIIAMGALGLAALPAGGSAVAEKGVDADTCRGGYRVMLMTPTECKAYLKLLGEVRARADRMAELELREWHTDLLIRRAEACPCREGEMVVLYQRPTAGKPKTYSY